MDRKNNVVKSKLLLWRDWCILFLQNILVPHRSDKDYKCTQKSITALWHVFTTFNQCKNKANQMVKNKLFYIMQIVQQYNSDTNKWL